MGRRKVVLVGWDGVREDFLRRLEPPALMSVAANGHWWPMTLPDASVAPTVTAVGWTTTLTGVWPGAHQVMSNEGEHHLLHRHPDVLTLAYCGRPSITTYAAASALIFGTDYGPGPLLGPGVQKLDWLDRRAYANGFSDTDPLILERAADALRREGPDLSFVYFGETDKVAHASGTSAAYEEAIVRQDARLERILAAIRSRESFAEEEWLVLVTTDHGHRDGGGHGGSTREERQTFLVGGCCGHPAPGTWREAANPVDVVPTIIEYLGVTVDRRWKFDGASLLSGED